MDLNLKNRSALVTGAARGLGYAIALGLAREGCRVAINSRDDQKLAHAARDIAKQSGSQVIALAGVSDLDVPNALPVKKQYLQRTRHLVCNAGGPADVRNLTKLPGRKHRPSCLVMSG
jgi:3-oxoacyl-[acyl-carrier protein] reductase